MPNFIDVAHVSIKNIDFVVSNYILDKNTLVSKLCASKIDEAIVEDLLAEFSDSLILEQGTLAYFTEKLWEDYGSTLADKISNNSAKSYNGNNSLEILRRLYDQIIKESLTSDYPSFSSLGESLKILDKVKRNQYHNMILKLEKVNTN